MYHSSFWMQNLLLCKHFFDSFNYFFVTESEEVFISWPGTEGCKVNWQENLIAFCVDKNLRQRSFSYGWLVLLSFPPSIFMGDKPTIIKVVKCISDFLFIQCAIFPILLVCFMSLVNRTQERNCQTATKCQSQTCTMSKGIQKHPPAQVWLNKHSYPLFRRFLHSFLSSEVGNVGAVDEVCEHKSQHHKWVCNPLVKVCPWKKESKPPGEYHSIMKLGLAIM